MQAVIQQIHRANMKAMLLSRMNLIMVGVNGAMMLMLIVTWGVSGSKESTGVLSRYAACIIAFILLAVSMVLAVLVHRLQPSLALYYSHQIISILTLAMMAIAMGMNSVVVTLCAEKQQLKKTQCGAHVAELIAELVVCISMGLAYASTQQRIVTFIDKGILDGIKGRSNGGMTQLP